MLFTSVLTFICTELDSFENTVEAPAEPPVATSVIQEQVWAGAWSAGRGRSQGHGPSGTFVG